ncbi:MAG: hypothetical protein HBSAPP03_11010 [Phycisphaerae bacterium]|nr:MAG: hypothetical protein HBSAPP03_11010 [Phycisphaerae bacterium]
MSTEARAHPGVGLGLVTVVSTLLGWSSIPLFLRYFIHDIDAWTANGWRYGLSALIWLPPLLLGWHRRNLPAGLWKAALVPSLWNIPAQVMFGLAPYYVAPGLMTFALRFHIVFLAIGAVLMFPTERRVIRSPGFLIGVGLVLVGTLGTIGLKEGGLGEGSGLGIAFCVGAGLLYACYALAVRKTMMGINPLTAFAAVNQLTGLGLVGVMLAFARSKATGMWDGGTSVLAMSHARIALLAASAVIGIGLGHTFYFLSIKRLGLAVSSAVVQLQPVVTSIASYFLFDEVLSMLQWSAGGVALAGAGVVLWTQHRATRAVPAAVEGATSA